MRRAKWQKFGNQSINNQLGSIQRVWHHVECHAKKISRLRLILVYRGLKVRFSSANRRNLNFLVSPTGDDDIWRWRQRPQWSLQRRQLQRQLQLWREQTNPTDLTSLTLSYLHKQHYSVNAETGSLEQRRRRLSRTLRSNKNNYQRCYNISCYDSVYYQKKISLCQDNVRFYGCYM